MKRDIGQEDGFVATLFSLLDPAAQRKPDGVEAMGVEEASQGAGAGAGATPQPLDPEDAVDLRPLRLQTMRTLANLAVAEDNRPIIAMGMPIAAEMLRVSEQRDMSQATARLIVNLSYDAHLAERMIRDEALLTTLVRLCSSDSTDVRHEVWWAPKLYAPITALSP